MVVQLLVRDELGVAETQQRVVHQSGHPFVLWVGHLRLLEVLPRGVGREPNADVLAGLGRGGRGRVAAAAALVQNGEGDVMGEGPLEKGVVLAVDDAHVQRQVGAGSAAVAVGEGGQLKLVPVAIQL